MIQLVLSKKDDLNQRNIIRYFKKKLKPLNIRYKITYVSKHIIEAEIAHIKENDFVFWHPLVAYNNLALVRKYNFSIVILNHRSLLIQKISTSNPINENTAINNGFYLHYIDEVFNDITNNDWKLVVEEESFIISFKKLKQLLLANIAECTTDAGAALLALPDTQEAKVANLRQVNFDD